MLFDWLCCDKASYAEALVQHVSVLVLIHL